MMPTTYGHAEGIDYNDIKSNNLLLVDGKSFEDRNKATALEAVEDANKLFNPQVVAWVIMGLLIVGIVGYLLIGAMQGGACQAKLVEIAGKCGDMNAADIARVNVTQSQELLPGVAMPSLPNMMPTGK